MIVMIDLMYLETSYINSYIEYGFTKCENNLKPVTSVPASDSMCLITSNKRYKNLNVSEFAHRFYS